MEAFAELKMNERLLLKRTTPELLSSLPDFLFSRSVSPLRPLRLCERRIHFFSLEPP